MSDSSTATKQALPASSSASSTPSSSSSSYLHTLLSASPWSLFGVEFVYAFTTQLPLRPSPSPPAPTASSLAPSPPPPPPQPAAAAAALTVLRALLNPQLYAEVARALFDYTPPGNAPSSGGSDQGGRSPHSPLMVQHILATCPTLRRFLALLFAPALPTTTTSVPFLHLDTLTFALYGALERCYPAWSRAHSSPPSSSSSPSPTSSASSSSAKLPGLGPDLFSAAYLIYELCHLVHGLQCPLFTLLALPPALPASSSAHLTPAKCGSSANTSSADGGEQSAVVLGVICDLLSDAFKAAWSASVELR